MNNAPWEVRCTNVIFVLRKAAEEAAAQDFFDTASKLEDEANDLAIQLAEYRRDNTDFE